MVNTPLYTLPFRFTLGSTPRDSLPDDTGCPDAGRANAAQILDARTAAGLASSEAFAAVISAATGATACLAGGRAADAAI